MRTLIATAEDSPEVHLVTFAAETGLRPCEWLALHVYATGGAVTVAYTWSASTSKA